MVKNESGVIPLEFHVLVKPEETELQKQAEAANLILPDTTHVQQAHATNEATVVEIGSMAFTCPDWPVTPKIGDKVLMKKYAGTIIRKDKIEYRIINDKDIGAILT